MLMAMSVLTHLTLLLVLLRTVHLQPIRDEDLLQGYGMRLAKRPYYPYKEDILSPFRFVEAPRSSQGQRKKAVDSTFIRFGRSSPSETPENGLMSSSDDHSSESSDSQPRFIVDHEGCRVTSTVELMRALMSDPHCIRAFGKAKRESVNDTFIRFGKREVRHRSESK